MANISNSSFRSRITSVQGLRCGPAKFQHNPQDFSDRVGMTDTTRQQYLRRNWDYLPANRLAIADSLSTKMMSLNGEQAIDLATGQFDLGLGA